MFVELINELISPREIFLHDHFIGPPPFLQHMKTYVLTANHTGSLLSNIFKKPMKM